LTIPLKYVIIKKVQESKDFKFPEIGGIKMSIELDLEGRVVQGRKGYCIRGIKALKEEELPQEYLEGYPKATMNGNYLYIKGTINSQDQGTLTIGETYFKETIDLFIEILKMAGKRLQKINQKLAKENADWEGVRTLIIV
jgi:hypothetical protein